MATGIDIMDIVNQITHIIWLSIEIPFKIWLSTPVMFRWFVLLFFLAISMFILYLVYRDRDEWRRRYIT